MHIIPKSFSAYLLDPEHGWRSIDRLTLDEAITECKQFRDDWPGSRVALVPDGIDPAPFLEFASAVSQPMFPMPQMYYSLNDI